MTRFMLSTIASAFLLAAPVTAMAQTPAPAAPAAPAKPMAMPMPKPAPKMAAKPVAKPAPKMAAAKPMAKPMVHKAAMKPGPTKAGDAAVEKLNEQSLAKAKAGI